MDNINKNLSGVEDTLFIPLIARIYVSKKFPEYFYDMKAIEIENKIPSNIIAEKSNEYSMLASASRAVVMDKVVTEFIKQNNKSNVVCIGCGLETMAFRLEKISDNVNYYEIDFPTVIKSRKLILGKLENETLIGENVNNLDFSSYLDCNLPTIFVVAGVFQYFKEEEVIALIKKLQNQFSNAEILFDVADEFGTKYAERYVKKTGNENAMMYFYINKPKEFAKKAEF